MFNNALGRARKCRIEFFKVWNHTHTEICWKVCDLCPLTCIPRTTKSNFLLTSSKKTHWRSALYKGNTGNHFRIVGIAKIKLSTFGQLAAILSQCFMDWIQWHCTGVTTGVWKNLTNRPPAWISFGMLTTNCSVKDASDSPLHCWIWKEPWG